MRLRRSLLMDRSVTNYVYYGACVFYFQAYCGLSCYWVELSYSRNMDTAHAYSLD